MHGLIHFVLKDLVIGVFGDAKLAAILQQLRVQDDTTILDTHRQCSDLSVAAVVAAAKVLDVSCEDALRALGSHFVDFIQGAGFLRMLQSMGDTLAAFMDNVNHLHQNLERQFQDAFLPLFQAERGFDSSRFDFSFASVRGGLLWPVVEGVLPRLGATLLQGDVFMVLVDTPSPRFWRTWKVVTSPLKEPEHQRQATLVHDVPFCTEHPVLANLFCCTWASPSSSELETIPVNLPFHKAVSALMRNEVDDLELDLLLNARTIDVCVAAFLRPTTPPLFLSAIKACTVKNAKCCVEEDRAVLQAKVDEYYFSNAQFERYARETAVAILASFEPRRVGRDTGFFDEQFVPWRNLASCSFAQG